MYNIVEYRKVKVGDTMLTDEKKYSNKVKFIELLTKLNIDLTELTKYLDAINYFDKPYTAQYTRAYSGGLCEQALMLCHELGVLCNAYFPGKYSEEDVIKVALFKDLYRAEMYEPYSRNVKNDETGEWEKVLAYRTKEERPTFGDLGFSSFMIARKFIDLNDEQIEAICHSSFRDVYTSDIHDILKSYPLTTLTHMAEMVTNYLTVEE